VASEQVDFREGVVRLEAHLVVLAVLVVSHGPNPRADDRDPPAAEGHLARFGAVAIGGAIGIVLSLRPGGIGHLGIDELVHDLEADRHRRGEQTLSHATGEQLELLVQLSRQAFFERRIGQVDEAELWYETRAARGGRLVV